MDRREALSVVSMICGGTVLGASGFLSGCGTNKRKSIFGILDLQQQILIEDVAETILPKSPDSPGAKDAEVGKFINSILSDCYSDLEQKAFLDGIKTFEELCILEYDEKFMELSPSDKHNLLLKLEEESKTFNSDNTEGIPPHYYTMIKQLSVWGYVSSEIVCTQVKRHVPIPGRYEGCLPYEPGEKAYS